VGCRKASRENLSLVRVPRRETPSTVISRPLLMAAMSLRVSAAPDGQAYLSAVASLKAWESMVIRAEVPSLKG